MGRYGKIWGDTAGGDTAGQVAEARDVAEISPEIPPSCGGAVCRPPPPFRYGHVVEETEVERVAANETEDLKQEGLRETAESRDSRELAES